jgi:trigger factor
MNFRLFLDKVPVDGGQAEHYPARLGDSHLIPGFEEQLIGMKAGEEKTFTLPFPKDNPNKQLAGKPVEIQAKVSQVFNVELPPLDDAFAASLGAFTKLDELNAKLEENLKTEREEATESGFELELLEEAVGKAEFDPIPDLLLHVETNRMLRELEDDIVRRGMKWSDYLQHLKKTDEELRKDFAPNAERRVKTALLLKHIADREAIALSENEINEAVQHELDLAAARGVLPDQTKTAEFREAVESHLRNKKTIDLLKSRARDA